MSQQIPKCQVLSFNCIPHIHLSKDRGEQSSSGQQDDSPAIFIRKIFIFWLV